MEQKNKKQNEGNGSNRKFDFKKRFSKFKTKEFMKKYGASVYMSLALMVVVATAVGVFSLSYSYDDIGDIDVEIPNISMPDINIPDFSPNTSKEPEKPVDNNQSGIIDDIVEKKYHYPLNGQMIKGFSVDALVFSETLGDYRVHTGIDISGEKGSAVCAYADGTILDIYDDPLMGKTVSIQHDYDMVSYYSNLASELPADIEKGKEVKSGDIIGAVGSTALCEIGDDSHIHFEIKVGNTFIDPTPELNGAIKK